MRMGLIVLVIPFVLVLILVLRLSLSLAFALGLLLGMLVSAVRLMMIRATAVRARTLRLRLGLRDPVRGLSGLAQRLLGQGLGHDVLDGDLVDVDGRHERRDHRPIGLRNL